MVMEQTKEQPVAAPIPAYIQEMMEAGMHLGHKTSKTHPKMRPYIVAVRNAIHIFDLEKTKEKLDEVVDILKKRKEEGKVILFVDTKVQMRKIVKEVAGAVGMPYVTERWIGGLLTNFPVMLKRIERMKELQDRLNNTEEKRSKKESAMLKTELERLEKRFSGIRNLTKLPDVIFALNLQEDMHAAIEAKKKGIEVIAIADTNVDSSFARSFVPANDDAIPSITYILEKVRAALGTAQVKEQEAQATA